MSDQLTPAAAGDAGRILLVDDEPTNLDILREALGGPNYRLFVARSGEEALRVAARARPLIVLLDVVMPGIDGYETCRRLKADPETRDSAVIFVSALTDPKSAYGGSKRARWISSRNPSSRKRSSRASIRISGSSDCSSPRSKRGRRPPCPSRPMAKRPCPGDRAPDAWVRRVSYR